MTLEKTERLLTLMNVLLATGRALPAQDLRRKVPGYDIDDAAFRRKFERDKVDLREMGVPLLVEEVPGVDPPVQGYRIRPQDYELRDPGLTDDELQALNLAAAVVGSEDGQKRLALMKLGAGLPAQVAEPELPGDPDLVAAFTGVAERRSLSFSYRQRSRRVDPYRLEFTRGRWYLQGYDHGHSDWRWFRLSRIDGDVGSRITLGDAPAAFDGTAPDRPLALEPWAVGGEDAPTTARVWIDSAVAGSVRRDLDAASIVSDDDDGLVVEFEVTNRDGFRGWLLSFLDRAEVLAPPDLRAEVVAWLEAAAHSSPAQPSGASS